MFSSSKTHIGREEAVSGAGLRGFLQKQIFAAIISTVIAFSVSTKAASPPGDVVGKVTVGYQGWFACTGDGAPINSWWHYSGTYQPPTYNTLTNHIHCWPDMRQYAKGYQTGFPNFNNGQPATLFSSYDDQTVQTHFRWMAENGIDTAALQRFSPFGGEGPTRNDMTIKVKNAAEAYGRKFYIMYDVSGWTAMQNQIKQDWTNVMLAQFNITNSPAYAFQNGKPVVCIWGFGFSDENHPWDAATCLDVINWFKSQGCYLIGGVPTHWRTEDSDSRPDFLSAYSAFDMISPWMVGRIGNILGTDSFRTSVNQPDVAYCNSHGIDYQPCVLPGDTGQRAHGNFMWRQFVNMILAGSHGIYISMFDEYNEGNQIACTAENASMIPVGTDSLYFTLDQDGTACSSDYYLRLTGDGARMLRGEIPFTTTKPTVPMFAPTLPAAPVHLVANGGSGLVNLTWAATIGANSYNIKRSTVSGSSYITVATNIGLVSYTDTGLANGTTYYYVVSAVNSVGEGPESAEISAIPFAATASASSQNLPNEGAAQAFDGLPATKWFNGNGGNTGWLQYYFGGPTKVVVGYALTSANDVEGRDPRDWQFQGSQNGSSWTTLDTRSGELFANRFTTKQYTFNNSTAYAYYRLNITATRSSVGSIQLAEMAFTYAAATPGDLAANGFSSSQIVLDWTPSSGAASYNVKRATQSGGPYTNVASGITAPTYWDKNLSPGSTYYYVISAVNSGGESDNSTEVSAMTLAAQPPPIPTSVTAVSGNAQIVLHWNPSSGATSYNVKRSTSSGGGYVLVANTTATGYTNTSLANGTKYYYVVTSVGQGGESPSSLEVSATPSVGIATASSENAPNESAAKAFDGSINTKWFNANGGNTGWLQLQFTDFPRVVVRYDLTSGNDVQGRDPRDWQFLGSQNGSSWTVLDTRSGEIFPTRGLTRQFTTTNATAYSYYRLNITANDGDASGIQLSEMAFTYVSTEPPQLNFEANAGLLQFNWPSDHIRWRLEMQTNSLSGLGTNWVTVPNSDLTNMVSFTTDGVSGSVFFRLVYP